jgi:iron complex transport system substrate-binding protein
MLSPSGVTPPAALAEIAHTRTIVRVRIVSLLPSTTEILFAIGAGDDVVGVTFECDFPPEARHRRIVSNTTLPEGLTPAQLDAEVRTRVASGVDLYHLDQGALDELDADVVVTQDLCAVCAVDVHDVDDALRHLGCDADIVTVDPMSLEDVLLSIEAIGEAIGRAGRARALVAHLRARLEAVAAATQGGAAPRLAVLEWIDPLYCAGHWVPDLVLAAGAEPAIGASGRRSFVITSAELHATKPDVIVVAPCGFDLDESTAQANALVETGTLPPHVPVWAVDANAAFVRPGPRLVDGVETLAGIAHPECVELLDGLARRVR